MSAVARKEKTATPVAALPEVMTAEEAAAFLRLPVSLLLRKTREGLIPGAKIGRSWRFSRRLLLKWVEEASLAEELDDEKLAQVVLERVAAGGRKIPAAEMKKRFGL